MARNPQVEEFELARFYRASRSEAEELLDLWVRPRRRGETRGDGESGMCRDLVRKVIAARLNSSGLTWSGERTLDGEIEDLVQEALVQLVGRLRESRTNGDQVRSLRAYARTVAEQHCDGFFRKVFRIRYNVSKRVEAQLLLRADFYPYRPRPDERYGSFTKWVPPPPIGEADRTRQIESNPASAVNQMFLLFPYQVVAKDGLPTTKQCMASALNWAGGALLFDLLVSTLQAARNEYDSGRVSLEDLQVAAPDELAVFTQDGPSAIVTFWNALKKVKRELARALMFNLEGAGEGQIAELLAAAGCASLSDLAELLGYDPDRFARDIVPSLPWTNVRIAEELGSTAAQVATWRNVAKTAILHYASQLCSDPDTLRGVALILGRSSHQAKTSKGGTS